MSAGWTHAWSRTLTSATAGRIARLPLLCSRKVAEQATCEGVDARQKLQGRLLELAGIE